MIKGLLKYLFGFAVADGGDPSVKLGTATIDPVKVDGLPTAPLTPTDVVIRLSDNGFAAMVAGTKVTGWFTNQPGGLTATVEGGVAQGAASITITLSGTPAVANADDIEITIPKTALTNQGSVIDVADNPNAAYRIDDVIRSIADFEAFARVVNDGSYGRDVDMLDDTTVINVPDTADYIPIARPVMGPNDELIYNPYIGTFNGNGGTINIELSGSASYLALFGANNGMIQNLTVGGTVTAEIDKNNPKDIDYVAGVVAYNDIGGTIERVITKITITADDSYVDPATKEEFSIHSIGGIAGFNGWDQYSPDSPHYTSQKLDTFQPGGYIHQCRNEGIAEPAPEEPDEGVIIGGQNKIGGIAGENAWKITECSNWGRIKCVKSGELHPRWPGVGGIAGRNGNNNTATEQGDIESCYNRGTIIDQTDKNIDHDDYGGITGWCDEDSTVKSCYTSGPFEQYAEDPEQPGMYIIQPATGSKNPIIGSIDEDVTTMTDNNNYALDTISTGDSKDPILIGIPKKCCEMTKPEFVTLLNGGPSGPYVQNTTEAPCYPKLAWEVPPPVSGEQQT